LFVVVVVLIVIVVEPSILVELPEVMALDVEVAVSAALVVVSRPTSLPF
jgi:hypothetical protein